MQKDSIPTPSFASISTQTTKSLRKSHSSGHKRKCNAQMRSPRREIPLDSTAKSMTPSFTDLNLGAAIITFWIFTTRTILVCMVIVNKWTTVFLQSCALLFWLFSIAAQQSSDYSDNDHPSRTPWYLTHSCAIAQPETQAACRVAQASFGTTIVLMYVSNLQVQSTHSLKS